jgi:hypothetical protein
MFRAFSGNPNQGGYPNDAALRDYSISAVEWIIKSIGPSGM